MSVSSKRKEQSTDVAGGIHPSPLSEEECFDLLSDYRRRLTVEYLRSRGEVTTIQELAIKIAARENGIPEDRLTDKQQKRVYTSLHHLHVPRMAEMGVIEYDEGKDTVAIGPSAATLEPYLDTDERKQTDRVPYAGLAILNLMAIGIVTVGWWVLPSVSAGGIVLLALVIFLLNALVHASVAATERESDGDKKSQ